MPLGLAHHQPGLLNLMRFLVYSSLDSVSIETSLGMADYSYYFVMQRFLPLLREFGEVVVLEQPPTDKLVESYQRDADCIFFSFTPPDKVAEIRRCPAIPVFAWEYSSIPDEPLYLSLSLLSIHSYPSTVIFFLIYILLFYYLSLTQ